MKKHHTALAMLARMRGYDAPEICGILTTAGLPCGTWRAYRLLRGESKLRPLEKIALAAALDVLPGDIDNKKTEIIT